MKKILSVMLLVISIIFVGGQNNFAEAKDVYITSYDWRDVFIVTESINKSEPNTVRVTVKYVKNGYLDEVEHRIYGKVDGTWWQNSEEGIREGVRALRVWELEEDKVLQYCLSY